ncbi:MAG TPA: cytochrome d ubiquinol oxidase subunit II [Candidatus Tetragenococcus pullicola]|nr:cytochrome d ubiquinol oxidase subunit II [Candidatus Tetragenococcus pullicola]
MSGLQLLWFVLIGVLFAAFFFFEGFDFGVGMAVRTLAFNRSERNQLIGAIGPVWDGNEVWLITAGGAMFASLPGWYASLFSGYYLILLLILVGLIIRGVSFEFRSRSEESKKSIWEWTLTIGSTMVPFFFGILFMSLIQGMPLDENGNIVAAFTDFINPFSILGGVALTLLCYLHGLNYIALKTTGIIRDRAKNYAQASYWILYLGLIVFFVLLYLKTDFFTVHPISTVLLSVLIVMLTIVANIAMVKGKELLAFLSSGATLVTIVGLLFSGLFPRVLINSVVGGKDLLIVQASSSPYTLKIMSIIALTILPFVLGYTIWTYYIFRKRIKETDLVGYDK